MDNNDISDLTGLEYATDLWHLGLWENRIKDITPLAGLSNLKSLYLGENQIEDISPLTELIHLQRLALWGNQIEDVSPLTNLVHLEYLDLWGNQVEELLPLIGLTDLKWLYLGDNQIIDLSPLAGLINLEELGLGENQIENITPLANLTDLTTLWLYFNYINDISPLSNLVDLNDLALPGNQIENISPLKNLTHITELWLAGNQIEDLTPLEHLNDLRKLYLGVRDFESSIGVFSIGNHIRDISPLASLNHLDLLHIEMNPLNSEAYDHYLPMILTNNQGINLRYDLPIWQTLTIDSTAGGDVNVPGEGTFDYVQQDLIEVEAIANDATWRFSGWTGTAVDAGDVADLHHPQTTVTISDSYTLTANFEPMDVNYPGLGYSLGTIPFEDPTQFDNLIVRNDDALFSFVTGLQPDPTGMMQMQAQAGQTAIAKAGFEQTSQEVIQVEFNYLFTEDSPGLELVVYLSDVPNLTALDDAQREDHYREVGVLTVPEAGRPGSVGSERFGTFSCAVEPNGLDLTHGSYLELALRINQPSQLMSLRSLDVMSQGYGSALIDGLTLYVACTGICLDLDTSTVADQDDFAMLMAHQGSRTSLSPTGLGTTHCLDYIYSKDGYVDKYDAHGLDRKLADPNATSYCDTCTDLMPKTKSLSSAFETMAESVLTTSDLLILGKQGRDAGSELNKLRDGFFGFDTAFNNTGFTVPNYNRVNIRLISNANTPAQLYVLNGFNGLQSLDTEGQATTILSHGFYDVNDHLTASISRVHLGIDATDPNNLSGRPIWDAVVRDDALYVVPAMVEQIDGSTFMVAVKIVKQSSQYIVTQVYDVRNCFSESLQNPALEGLREIEVDTDGNVYILNAHYLNESDQAFRFGTDGSLIHVSLNHPDDLNQTPDPLGLTVDSHNHLIYVASGQALSDGNAKIAVYHSSDLSFKETLTVSGMSHVTDTTVASDGTLWVIGYRLGEFFDYPFPKAKSAAFYVPCLAKFGTGVTQADAHLLNETPSDLSLPLSIVSTK